MTWGLNVSFFFTYVYITFFTYVYITIYNFIYLKNVMIICKGKELIRKTYNLQKKKKKGEDLI